jgi:hypothetical protein
MNAFDLVIKSLGIATDSQAVSRMPSVVVEGTNLNVQEPVGMPPLDTNFGMCEHPFVLRETESLESASLLSGQSNQQSLGSLTSQHSRSK